MDGKSISLLVTKEIVTPIIFANLQQVITSSKCSRKVAAGAGLRMAH